MNETQYTAISVTHGSANGHEKEKQKRADAAELNVHVSEERYRRLFEAAQDGILILEAETGRVTDANPFLVKLLGFSLSEMVGKTVGELSPFKDFVCNQAMLERVQKDGYARYEDLPLETNVPDGHARRFRFFDEGRSSFSLSARNEPGTKLRAR